MSKYLFLIFFLILAVDLSSCKLYTVSFGTGSGVSLSANGTAFVHMVGETHLPRGWQMAYTNGTILSKPSLILPNQIYRAGVDSRIFTDTMRSTVKFQWFDKSEKQEASNGIHVSNITVISTYRRPPGIRCFYQIRGKTPIKSGEQREFYLEDCHKRR